MDKVHDTGQVWWEECMGGVNMINLIFTDSFLSVEKALMIHKPKDNYLDWQLIKTSLFDLQSSEFKTKDTKLQDFKEVSTLPLLLIFL